MATSQGEQLKTAADRAESVHAQANELKAWNAGLEQQLQDAQLELSELKRLLEEKEVTNASMSKCILTNKSMREAGDKYRRVSASVGVVVRQRQNEWWTVTVTDDV